MRLSYAILSLSATFSFSFITCSDSKVTDQPFPSP